jgi:hypothetical protein
MAYKESERFSSTPQKLPYPPGEVFPTLCLVIDLIWVKIITPMVQQVNFVAAWLAIDLIRSEDHHSHPPTSELCGCMMVPTYSRIRFLRMWSTRRCVCFIFSMQHNLLKFLD